MYKIDARLFNTQHKDFCRAKVGRLLSERTVPAKYGTFHKLSLIGEKIMYGDSFRRYMNEWDVAG